MTLLSLQVFAKPTFNQWLTSFKSELTNEYGFSRFIVERAFDGVTFNQRVIDFDRRQPEFVMSMGRYMKIVINDSRVSKGKKYRRQLDGIFNDIKDDYNFQAEYLLAFWAMETNFSSNTGSLDIIRSLATLVYDGRRSDFFKLQLIDALRILERRDIVYPTRRMQGSWAGAMGSTQFIPPNILKYAIDYSGDGVINMWNDRRDFLGSSANFLTQVGWDGDTKWGYEVKLDNDFNYLLSGLHTREDLEYWLDNGVSSANATPLPQSQEKLTLWLPQGHRGPAFLIYPNFRTTLKWNNSSKYALAIGVLSDLIRNEASYFSKFNLNEESFLSFEMAKDIQRSLNNLGHDAGKVDGIPGPKTFKAVQSFQEENGLIPDGYLTKEISELILRQ